MFAAEAIEGDTAKEGVKESLIEAATEIINRGDTSHKPFWTCEYP
jgi:hypothetical protein